MVCSSAGVQAGVIDTVTGWNGTSFISAWAVQNTATYGQTITATQSAGKLQDFTFYLFAPTAGTAADFQAFVYSWDGTKIAGSALYTSSILTAPTTATFTPITINTGGLILTPGQQYVLMFTTSSVAQASPSISYRYGSPSIDAYAGGTFVFQNNGTNFANLSTVAWSSFTSDLAFTATLDSLLHPSSDR